MITHSKAILAVSDVKRTIDFYLNVLGFTNHWLWEDPPTFGGASWGSVEVMFCLQPDLAGKVEGHQHMFFADDINELHRRHTEAGAPVIVPIGNRPWGVREYTVRDPNGYHLRFGGPVQHERPATGADTLPDHIRIDLRVATLEEYVALNDDAGWNRDLTTMPVALARTTLGVVAIDTRDNRAVGMLRVVGDGRYFTFWDVMVLKSHQGQKIGSAMMRRALQHLETIGPKGAYVGLFTGKPKFYEQFGFQEGGGMSRRL